MCGIAGLVASRKSGDFDKERNIRVAESIIKRLDHRGPDGNGCWSNSVGTVVLSHSRLAIHDLTETGAQPMSSVCGKYTLAFNGEIYNFQEILTKLNAEFGRIHLRGSSDTEVLLESLVRKGIDWTLNAIDGMFAFSFYDEFLGKVFLCVDQISEKPLYFTKAHNSVYFASELKGFCAVPGFERRISSQSFQSYLALGYIPHPNTIYDDVFKLPPASILSIDVNTPEVNISALKFWGTILAKSQRDAFVENPIDELDSLLQRSIEQRLVSDVPVGLLLSSGVDSNLIAAVASLKSNSKLQAFTIGSDDARYNEAEAAGFSAKKLGIEHHILTPENNAYIDAVHSAGSVYCEPIADISCVPTLVLHKLVSRHVKVAISGDAGDELFCGYNRHQFVKNYWHKVSNFPYRLRVIFSSLVLKLNIRVLASLFNLALPLVNASLRSPDLENKIYKGLIALRSKDIFDFYFSAVAMFEDLGFQYNLTLHKPLNVRKEFSGCSLETVMNLDKSFYLPGNINVKNDRASMRYSVEVRAPFLSKEIIEYTNRIPFNILTNYSNSNKPLLKALAGRYVPMDIIQRPKMGFSIEMDVWLRTSLKDWAQDLLTKEKLEKHGFFDAGLVASLWERHQSGVSNLQRELWCILAFQNWYENNY